jgi:hypothetical protein
MAAPAHCAPDSASPPPARLQSRAAMHARRVRARPRGRSWDGRTCSANRARARLSRAPWSIAADGDRPAYWRAADAGLVSRVVPAEQLVDTAVAVRNPRTSRVGNVLVANRGEPAERHGRGSKRRLPTSAAPSH